MRSQNTKFNICGAIADAIFNRTTLKLKTYRHHRQIVTQRLIEIFDLVSNLTAFRLRQKGASHSLPSCCLQLLQLSNFPVQNIRIRHAGSHLKRRILSRLIALAMIFLGVGSLASAQRTTPCADGCNGTVFSGGTVSGPPTPSYVGNVSPSHSGSVWTATSVPIGNPSYIGTRARHYSER
jgi:hypothetical protein